MTLKINLKLDLSLRFNPTVSIRYNNQQTAATIKTEAKGLAALPAVAVGASATEDLTQVFRLSNQNNENIFNVSVNGVPGIIEIPQGFYVGTTLAEALQERMNQIEGTTGIVGGGITVSYN